MNQIISQSIVDAGLAPNEVNKLMALWQEPQRVYHTIENHLQHMLANLYEMIEAHGIPTQYRSSMLAAAWYHDAIYIPGRKDNEYMSALVAEDAGRMWLKPVIMATVNHKNPASFWEACVLDADLAGLGRSPEIYGINRQFVREEYGFRAPVPLGFGSYLDAKYPFTSKFEVDGEEPEWVNGRKAFLEEYLNRSFIFHTGWGAQFEAGARENLEAELAKINRLIELKGFRQDYTDVIESLGTPLWDEVVAERREEGIPEPQTASLPLDHDSFPKSA